MPEVNPKPTQQIYFTEDLDRAAIMFFITEGAKETNLDFSQAAAGEL